MKTISFFSDDITINVHTASAKELVGHKVSLKDFANGEPLSLYIQENGELIAFRGFRQDNFMEGPEV